MSMMSLPTAQIQQLFAEEIEAHSGQVTDVFDDGTRLFARSILPQLADVLSNDSVHGGVAIKATAKETCVFPYVFRQICRNGAIMPNAFAGRRVVFCENTTPQEFEQTVRETIAACCQAETFKESVVNIRGAIGDPVNLALTLLPFLSNFRQGRASSRFVAEILQRFFQEETNDRFGLMNAVTSVARDTKDPEDRWRLEELGGGIAARITPPQPSDLTGVQYQEVARSLEEEEPLTTV